MCSKIFILMKNHQKELFPFHSKIAYIYLIKISRSFESLYQHYIHTLKRIKTKKKILVTTYLTNLPTFFFFFCIRTQIEIDQEGKKILNFPLPQLQGF